LDTYDLIILGGGPTGAAAGLYGTRSRLNTLLIERGLVGGQLAVTEDVENYPGFEHILGPELGQKLMDHAEKFGLNVEYAEVEDVELEGDYKVVTTDDGEIRAKTLIIATGSMHNKLEVPGEDEFSGRGVSYCAVCDGAFFRDKELVVVGGGDAAVEEGAYLTRFASKVTIIHRRDELRAQKILQERAFANEKMDFLWNTTVQEIKGNGLVDKLVLKDTWCKGKRERVLDIRTEAQRAVLEEAKQLAATTKQGSLIPTEKYIQQVKRFEYQTRKAGLHGSHGLRHQFAQRRYLELAGFACPLAGGPKRKDMTPEMRRTDYEVRLEITRELGHGRASILQTYCG